MIDATNINVSGKPWQLKALYANSMTVNFKRVCQVTQVIYVYLAHEEQNLHK